MSTNLVDLMFGSETFPTGNANVQVYAVPCTLYNSFKSEMHVDAASKKAEVPMRMQSKSGRLNAYSEVFRDDQGHYTQGIYQIPDGFILKVFAHRAGTHGQRTINAAQYIRVRSGAAYREMKVKLTGHPKARFEYAIIKGCFDILSLEEAEKTGVRVNPNFRSTFRPADVAAIMEFKTLTPERETPVIVRERIYKRDGETIVVTRKKKARMIDLED